MSRAREYDEAGFTLPEVLMTITVMGLIAFPIAMVLMHSITLVPQAGSRSGAAADRAFLVDDFSDDVANSTAATAKSVSQCFDWNALNAELTNETKVLELDGYDNHVVTYVARVVSADGYAPPTFADAATDVHTVTIERVEDSGVPDVVFEGYCSAGDGLWPVVAVAHGVDAENGVRHRKVELKIRLRDARDGEPHLVTLVAAMRKTD